MTKKHNTSDEHSSTTKDTDNENVSSNGKGTVPSTAAGVDTFALLGIIFAFLIPPLGFVFSIMGYFNINQNPERKGKGIAIAGMIIAAIMTVLLVMLLFSLASPTEIVVTPTTVSQGVTTTTAAVATTTQKPVTTTTAKPASQFTEGCTINDAFTCTDFMLTPNTFSATISNDLKRDLVIREAYVTYNGNTCKATPSGTFKADGWPTTLFFNVYQRSICNYGSLGDKVEGKITISYHFPSDDPIVPKTVTGEFKATIR
jgi:hypothetical protein